jgi:hypothetical protein
VVQRVSRPHGDELQAGGAVGPACQRHANFDPLPAARGSGFTCRGHGARSRHPALAEQGILLLVEPMAGEDVEANINVFGRIFYSASTVICTPNAQSQGGRYTLGAQVPDATWAQIMATAGLSTFRRATQTPFNRVFEVRR